VEQAEDQPYSVLCELELIGNEAATARYLAFQEERLDWVERLAVIEMTAASLREGTHHFLVDDQFPKFHRGMLVDSKLGTAYKLQVSARRMGEDNGKAVFFRYGEQINQNQPPNESNRTKAFTRRKGKDSKTFREARLRRTEITL
jgi:hypothetical protein